VVIAGVDLTAGAGEGRRIAGVDLTAGAGVKVAGSPALEHAVAFASTRERMAGTDAGNSGDGWMGARLPDTAGREARKREKNYLHPAAEKRHCSLVPIRDTRPVHAS
jgi:hypothetical protein